MENKKSLKEFIQELLETKLKRVKEETLAIIDEHCTKQELNEELSEIIEDPEEKAVLAEQFEQRFTDEATDNISKHFTGDVLEISEDELGQLEESTLELDVEDEEYIKQVADEIKLVDDLLKIKCMVNGYYVTKERYLIEGTNCNIKPIPLLNVALISNLGVSVQELWINENMESVMDVELLVVVKDNKENYFMIKTTVGILHDLGLLTCVDSFSKVVDLSPIEYRGLTNNIDMEEIEQILKFSSELE